MRIHFRVLATLALGLGGCRTYQERPLVPAEVLQIVERSRDLDGAEAGAGGPNFEQAARWLHRGSPALRAARARLVQARAVADTGVPLPNPTLAVGPLLGTNLGPDVSERFQPFVAFGFTIPLSGVRSRQAEVDEAAATAARVTLILEHRQQYLALRRGFTEWSLTQERQRLQQQLRTAAAEAAALSRRLVEAGEASALDAGVIELDVARSELALLEARSATATAVEQLATLTGVHPRHFREPYLASELPAEVTLPELAEAKQILVANHPELVRLRSEYEVAERRLRMEIARQYPDLTLGTSFEGDPGDDKKIWGLALGVTLPIFDRNQRGIANAEHERERVRTAYEAVLSQALSELEGRYARHAIVRQKRQLLVEQILPRSAANLESARQAIRAGAFDALEYLEVERRMRATRVEALEVEADLWSSIHGIESLLGTPVCLLPEERDREHLFVPESLAAPEPRAQNDGEKR